MCDYYEEAIDNEWDLSDEDYEDINEIADWQD